MELKRLRNYGFLKIPNARSGKRRCNGCSPTIAWLRRCRTFITRNSSLNLPRLRIASPLTADDLVKIDGLYADNFGVEEAPPKFKGTMELPKETAAA